MSDFGTLTQQAVLDKLATAGAAEPLLQSLQQGFETIRQCYRKKRPPPFSDVRVRAAYGAAGAQMLGLKDGASVVVLGAGPGPEVVGLAQYLVEADRRLDLEIHLVDREVGWRATREATIDAVLDRIEGFDRSSFHIHSYEHDLGSTEGVKETASLLARTDLVVMETLLTELPTPAKDGHLVDWLIDRLPHDGRLLLIDLGRVRQHAASQSKLSRAAEEVLDELDCDLLAMP